MNRKILHITLREAILGILADAGEIAVGSFFPSKYPIGRFWRRLAEGKTHRKSPRTFSSILSQLRADGLVERRGPNKIALWRITPKGVRRLHELNEHAHDALKKQPKRDGIRRLVIFDIPEREKGKRQAIRRELLTIGYSQLQKSVWSGDFSLPPDFIELLDTLDLRAYVHIFSVRNVGTLRGLK